MPPEKTTYDPPAGTAQRVKQVPLPPQAAARSGPFGIIVPEVRQGESGGADSRLSGLEIRAFHSDRGAAVLLKAIRIDVELQAHFTRQFDGPEPSPQHPLGGDVAARLEQETAPVAAAQNRERRGRGPEHLDAV